MDYLVLGISFGDKPVDDLYVVRFSIMFLNLFPLLPALLVIRIWCVHRKATRLRGRRNSQLGPILHVLIDAGVIYSLALLVALICFVTQSNGQYVVLDMVSNDMSLLDEDKAAETLLLTTRSRPSSRSRFTWLLSVSRWSVGLTK